MKRILSAYPLFVKDPYFSFWADSEDFGNNDVIFWTGEKKGLYGILRAGGKTYSFTGKIRGVTPMRTKDIKLTAFTTDCTFTADGITLCVSFVSPLAPDDFEMMSCPVCYIKCEVSGCENAEVMLALREDVCYSRAGKSEMQGGEFSCGNFDAAFMGLSGQAPFSHNNDASCADWGYFYLAGEEARYVSGKEFYSEICCSDYSGEQRKFILASAKNGVVAIGHDDVSSVRYFGETLKGYYLNGHGMPEAFDYVFCNISAASEKLGRFDSLIRRHAEIYGEDYYNILAASLRQSIGAHKLVKNGRGELLFLSKECCSNGCIATVDVTYPSAPLYLLFNPELLRGMLVPVFEFAKMPVWIYDFAPHDVGTYPVCCGQVYGLNDD